MAITLTSLRRPVGWKHLPATFTCVWRRYDAAGSACRTIAAATGLILGVFWTIRFDVTVANTAGSGVATPAKSDNKRGGWRTISSPSFRHHGQRVWLVSGDTPAPRAVTLVPSSSRGGPPARERAHDSRDPPRHEVSAALPPGTGALRVGRNATDLAMTPLSSTPAEEDGSKSAADQPVTHVRRRRRRLHLLLKLFAAIVTLATAAAVGVGIYAYRYYQHNPACDPRQQTGITLGRTSFITAADGSALGAVPATIHREPVPAAAISPWLPKALIAIEDRRFFEHSGVDWKGIVRAGF